MAIYLRAADGAYAERVLVAGDPGRIARLARTLEHNIAITQPCINQLVGHSPKIGGH